jgi:hypothetical protein
MASALPSLPAQVGLEVMICRSSTVTLNGTTCGARQE